MKDNKKINDKTKTKTTLHLLRSHLCLASSTLWHWELLCLVQYTLLFKQLFLQMFVV